MRLDDLTEQIRANYDLTPPIESRLLRAYTNDVYRVNSLDKAFVLKMYGREWRTEAEIRYELALIQHLSARGLPVAQAASGNAQDALTTLETADGPRFAVLYDFAEGEKPEPPFTPALYEAFGQAIGRMHALSDDFVTDYARPALNLEAVIDAPVELAAPLLENAEDRAFLLAVAAQVKAGIQQLAAEGLDWGPIHGDATLDNLHVTATGDVILYDFDSGGAGWRAADLQGWAANAPEYKTKWDAFLRGYSQARPVQANDLRAAPYLTVAWDLWGIKIDLDNRILTQGLERTQAYLGEQIAALRQRRHSLLRENEL